MTAALGITPSDDDKLFSVEALDLEPCTPVRLVPATDAFRHDALNTVLAGQPMEGRAMTDLMIVVAKTSWRAIEQRCQSRLAVHQRQSHQVFAVQVQ
jgi:hypothetical protein